MFFKKGYIPVFLLISANVFLSLKTWCQSYARMENPQYTQLKFFEDFTSTSLDTSVWSVVSGIKKDNLYIFADNETTVSQADGNLELSMHWHPGFASKTWSPAGDSTITADFIAGEVMTHESFSYGIFECSATFASDRGSFPAFWLYSNAMCFETERPEIDIVELKANRRNPTLDNNIWYYPLNCLPQTSHEFEKHPFTWGGTHIFKAIWTPSKIEFLVDNQKIKEVLYNGQHWYPKLQQHLLLSQQIVRYGRINRRTKNIVTPQTSYFHWVKVKAFFLAPQINCSENIWETVQATLDVDPSASDITWELVPGRLFMGKTEGKGPEADITPSSNSHGAAKIIFRFKMPSGETFVAEKEFQLNGLQKL